MTINKAFIVGSGLMGSGIAQVCAQSGLSVTLNDVNEAALSKALASMEWSVKKFVEKGKLEEKTEAIMDRITVSTDLSLAADADLIIEAVFEKLEAKQEIFKELDAVCKPEAVMASNTSAIPITELGAATRRPESVIGLHFFSPVPMMPAVEVIKGIATSEAAMNVGTGFVKRLKKRAIRVESDVPGFLINRIHLIAYVEAIRLLESGIGTVSDIDAGVRLALGRRMGPFETGDMVGLDVSFGGLSAIYEESKDMRYYPPQLLRRKVKGGELGRKTGKGWYRYNENGEKMEK